MKGRIAISTVDGEKILLDAGKIETVKENKTTGHTEIQMYEKECESHVMQGIYVTNESFDEIFKKIIDASAKERKETEDAWSIMRLLFKVMNENGDAAKTQEQTTESMWEMMGGYPACKNCGCSPADWEDGFPPYCHGCGARMTNGRI